MSVCDSVRISRTLTRSYPSHLVPKKSSCTQNPKVKLVPNIFLSNISIPRGYEFTFRFWVQLDFLGTWWLGYDLIRVPLDRTPSVITHTHGELIISKVCLHWILGSMTGFKRSVVADIRWGTFYPVKHQNNISQKGVAFLSLRSLRSRTSCVVLYSRPLQIKLPTPVNSVSGDRNWKFNSAW
jgi:hypothetical protein